MKMDRLREELRTRNENELKMRLKSVNHKLDYSVLAAVTGTERIEEVKQVFDLTCRYLRLPIQTFCPLASLLVSRHLWLMSKPDVSPEVVEEATWSILVLLEAMRGRIEELKMIWRRQRMDVDTQIRYYSNGLLEDYYRVRHFPIYRARCRNCSSVVRNTARRSLTPTWKISEKRANGALRTNGPRRMEVLRVELRMFTSRITRTFQALPSQVSSDWRSSLIYRCSFNWYV